MQGGNVPTYFDPLERAGLHHWALKEVQNRVIYNKLLAEGKRKIANRNYE
jgi:hypothetical protein